MLDDFVEDLSSKVVKSTDDKVCVEVTGFINPQKIDMVRAEIMADRSGEEIDDDIVAQIIENTEDNFRFKPQNLESLALVYLKDVEYYNGTKSPKYAQFLKDKMKDNPYYYLTEDEELADYVITPKVLKAKIDALDEKHKRLQMVVSLEISGITDEVVLVLRAARLKSPKASGLPTYSTAGIAPAETILSIPRPFIEAATSFTLLSISAP